MYVLKICRVYCPSKKRLKDLTYLIFVLYLLSRSVVLQAIDEILNLVGL